MLVHLKVTGGLINVCFCEVFLMPLFFISQVSNKSMNQKSPFPFLFEQNKSPQGLVGLRNLGNTVSAFPSASPMSDPPPFDPR